jgi:hypothetical protein
MLSSSSGLKLQGRAQRTYIGPEKQGLREGSQSEGGNMGTGCGPIESLQAGYRDGVGMEWKKGKKRRFCHFSP